MGSGERASVDARPSSALIASGWRRAAVLVTTLCLLGFVALSARLHDVRDTHLDRRIADWAYLHLHGGAARALSLLIEAPVSIALVAVVVIGAVLVRQWRVAVWALVTPVVAVLLAEAVLKPVVNRLLGTSPGVPAFPSGHATALASALLVLAVLVVRAPSPLMVRLAVLVGLGAWFLAGCLGLVRNFQHYTSDTVGGFLLAGVCVLGGALLLDVVAGRRERQLTWRPSPCQ